MIRFNLYAGFLSVSLKNMENLKLLFQLYFRPLSTMSDIMDRANWSAAAIIFLIISAGFNFFVNSQILRGYAVSQYDYYLQSYNERTERNLAEQFSAEELREAEIIANQEIGNEKLPFPLIGKNVFWLFNFEGWFFSTLLLLTIFYVPLTILLTTIFGGLGRFGVNFQNSYATLSTCAMMAWSAAHLPFTIAAILLSSQSVAPQRYLGFWVASGILFGIFMVFALRVVFGVSYAAAVSTIAVSWLGFSPGIWIFRFVSPFLFSPFLLIMAYSYFGRSVMHAGQGFGDTFRRRQDFKRYLDIATINPRDADAHVQLGLIYKQRRQNDKAFEHFQKAYEIDKSEPDANFELGKIHRERGDLQLALDHFTIVLEQNDKHSLNEIWREIGVTYFNAGMFDEAENMLETFLERRPYDPEGLYFYGKVLQKKGKVEKAEENFKESIEAVKSSPPFRRSELRKWSKLAEKELS